MIHKILHVLSLWISNIHYNTERRENQCIIFDTKYTSVRIQKLLPVHWFPSSPLPVSFLSGPRVLRNMPATRGVARSQRILLNAGVSMNYFRRKEEYGMKKMVRTGTIPLQIYISSALLPVISLPAMSVTIVVLIQLHPINNSRTTNSITSHQQLPRNTSPRPRWTARLHLHLRRQIERIRGVHARLQTNVSEEKEKERKLTIAASNSGALIAHLLEAQVH